MTTHPTTNLHSLVTATRTVAEQITAPRIAFRQFYDDYLVDASWSTTDGHAAGPSSFLHAIFLAQRRLLDSGTASTKIELDPIVDKDAITLALLALGTAEAMAQAATCAIAAGLCDPTPASGRIPEDSRKEAAGVVATAFGHMAVTATLQRGFEKVTNANETWTDPDNIMPAILLAGQRLCRVEALDRQNNKVIGTGFLIGPSAVLTNWHVVEELENPLTDLARLKVIFDHSRTSGLPSSERSVISVRKAWCLASSPTGKPEPDAPDEGWWIDAGKRLTWIKGLGEAFDFAVIHVEGAPGLQRGWFDLSKTGLARLRGSCYVLHHPSGQGRTFSAGAFCFDGDPSSIRRFHTASTAKGSSGGLVLDDSGRPAALHYLGLGREIPINGRNPVAPQDVVNVAIPLSAIASKLNDQLKDITAVEGITLERGCLDGKRPVFGRTGLLAAIESLTTGERQVLRVKPPSNAIKKPGKSYTVDILEALLPGPTNIYLKFTADQIKPGGQPLAATILKAFSRSGADELPEPATTEAAYEKVLVNYIRDTIAARWPKHRLWLVIDELDVHELTDASGRRFLNTLYAKVREIPQLRIVLVGLQMSLETIPEEALLESPIPEAEFNDIRQLFEEWLIMRGARDKPIDPAVSKIIASALASYAGSEAPLASLADFTAKHLNPALKAYFGA